MLCFALSKSREIPVTLFKYIRTSFLEKCPTNLCLIVQKVLRKYLSLAVGQQLLKLMMKNTYNNINATIMPVQNCDFQHETKAVASRPC